MSSQSSQIRISRWVCWIVGRSLQNSFHVHRSLATVPLPHPFFSLHATNKHAGLIGMKKNSVASTCFLYHPVIKVTALTCAKPCGLFLVPHSYFILIWKVCLNIILSNVYLPACFASCILELVKFQGWDHQHVTLLINSSIDFILWNEASYLKFKIFYKLFSFYGLPFSLFSFKKF